MKTKNNSESEQNVITTSQAERTFVRHTDYNPNRKPKNQKRKTYAAVIKDNVISFGIAVCGSKDHFVKKVGRQIALQRAIESPVLIRKVKPSEDVRKVFFNSLNAL